MARQIALESGQLFHIFNRGNNREDLFRTDDHYRTFLALYTRYVSASCETYAYYLLRNHFHLLVRVRNTVDSVRASRSLSNFFNAYAKNMNGVLHRTGSLFEHPFHRKLIENEQYAQRVVIYIHQNPQRHGFVSDYRKWPWSSFPAFTSPSQTRIDRDTVKSWYGGEAGFLAAHSNVADETIANQDYWES